VARRRSTRAADRLLGATVGGASHGEAHPPAEPPAQGVSNKADFVGMSPRLLSIGLSP